MYLIDEEPKGTYTLKEYSFGNKPRFNKRFYPREDLQGLLLSTHKAPEGLYFVDDFISDAFRWGINHYLVFRDKSDNKLYMVMYEETIGGRHTKPFEDDGDEIECYEAEEYMQPSYRKIVINDVR